MSAEFESRFTEWATPPGSAEQERIGHAISMVRAALDADESLRSSTKVFVQGSYRNRVNVRRDSDVDIGVLYTGSAVFVSYPSGMTHDSFGNTESSFSYSDFKERIRRALAIRFGSAGVTCGDKAIRVHANSYRIDADVVPLLRHREYRADGSYLTGVELRPTSGGRIVNWPEQLYPDWPLQHYENAVAKNDATGRAYKGVVRIFRKLRYLLADAGSKQAAEVKGFLLECMLYNAPNEHFSHSTWDASMRSCLAFLWQSTRTEGDCASWAEVSGRKWLFRGQPDEKRISANAYLLECWSHIGIIP